MRIYIAGSISGKDVEEVKDYFNETTWMLRSLNYEVLSPMTGKGKLRTEAKYRAKDYRHPIATNRAIIGRDRWMVGQADVVYCNLYGASHVSIGSMMELAWARELRKHTIVVMEEDNVHQHAFVLQCADIIFPTPEEAEEYLADLVGGEI